MNGNVDGTRSMVDSNSTLDEAGAWFGHREVRADTRGDGQAFVAGVIWRISK